MAYVALYRAYRPKSFTEVAGQQVIIQTLQNAIKYDKIGHAYLFSGPRGTGKTSIAKIFAKAVNCLNPLDGNPCNQCDVCKGIDKGDIPDVIEIDAASNNGVDEIRELRDKVKYMPSVGRYKVYIIDEVHMLTTGAFNALLKTLEEPPKHVIFILATTEVHKIPATILSRCQRFDFKNIELKDIILKLKEVATQEKINITDEAIEAIALNAEGGLRDALSLLDQTISFTKDKITDHEVHQVSGSVSKETLRTIILNVSDKKIAEVMTAFNFLLEEGKEPSRITNDLILALRDLLLEKTTNRKLGYEALVKKITIDKIYYYLDILSQLQQDIKWTHQKRAYIEIAFIKMMEHETLDQIDQEAQILDLKQMVFDLKDKIENTRFSEENKPKKVKEDQKALVTSKDIEEILNNPDKDKKETLLAGWSKLANYPKETLKATAQLLSIGELVATSNHILVVYDDIDYCEQLLDPKVKKQVQQIFNNKAHLVDDIYSITRSDWNSVLKEFKEQWKNGNKRPNISERDYGLYHIKKQIKKEKQAIVELAYEYFGELVKIED